MMLVLMVYNRPRSAQRWMMMMGRRRECGWGEEDRATYCSWWCRSRYQKDSREATVSGCLSRACWTRLLSWLLGVTVPRDRVFRETFGRAMQMPCQRAAPPSTSQLDCRSGRELQFAGWLTR